MLFFFFFSSRRRHTRLQGDWSSDVCSSDLTRVIVVVEELVDEAVIRSDPNRTLIPGMIVDAVVAEPWGAHPSYAQGYYDRDNDFYVAWEGISRDPGRLEGYLEEYVRGVPDRAAYMAKQPSLVARLKAQERYSSGVNYGF